jgi:WS/DGAT/MGAT family acyltransferase
MPEPEPSNLTLVGDALLDAVMRPTVLNHAARIAWRDLRAGTERFTWAGGGLLGVAQTVLRRSPPSPLRVDPGEQRRMAIARTRLADHRAVRRAFGTTVNDVVLAVVSGAVRGWLLARAVQLRSATTVRALVPVSTLDAQVGQLGATGPAGSGGNPTNWYRYPAPGRIQPFLVDLPVGEADPLVRLAQLRYATATHRISGRAIAAERLVDLAGFAPPTLHARGVRAANQLAHRQFNLVITNAPGPQVPLYAAGVRMSEIFPIPPLGRGQAMTVGLTSYDGGVYYGVNADWDAVRDVGLFAELLEESLVELLEAAEGTTSGSRVRRRPATPAGLVPHGPGPS